MLTGCTKGKAIAIVGWHEGLAGQLHALLAVEGVSVGCFVNEFTTVPDTTNRPKRLAQLFDYPEAESYKGLPLVTSSHWIEELKKRDVGSLLIASPDSIQRQRVFKEGEKYFAIATYVHESATVLPEASIQHGAIVLANAFVGYRAEIHACTVVNTGAQVDHNSVVGAFSNIMPRATLAGSVEIGLRVTVGAGAIVLNRVRIADDAYVGAGALVRHDVPIHTMVVGVPAQFHRNLKQ